MEATTTNLSLKGRRSLAVRCAHLEPVRIMRLPVIERARNARQHNRVAKPHDFGLETLFRIANKWFKNEEIPFREVII